MEHTCDNVTSSYAPELRRRADHLVRLAADVERALALTLPDIATRRTSGLDERRARLCAQVLETNLHQLHRAADELRQTALAFRRRADELDEALRNAA